MLQRLVIVVAGLVLTLVGAGPAGAQYAREFYVVTDVPVAAEQGAPARARDEAFLTGQRTAVQRLFQRLQLPVSAAESLSDDEITRLLQRLTVQSETPQAAGYRGVVTYVFSPQAVTDLLARRGLTAAAPPTVAWTPPPQPGLPPAVSESTAETVLLLPVLRAEDQATLWDSPNPWHEAWLNHQGGNIVVPWGDVADVSDIGADRALAGDQPALMRIAGRYQAVAAVVAIAEWRGDRLTVALKRYAADGRASSDTIEIPAASLAPAVFAAAVGQAAERLSRPAGAPPPVAVVTPVAPADPVAMVPAVQPAAPRPLTVPPSNISSRFGAIVPLPAPDAWLDIRDRLGRLPLALTVVALSPTLAIVELGHGGDRSSLGALLAQEQLALVDGASGLELRRTNAP